MRMNKFVGTAVLVAAMMIGASAASLAVAVPEVASAVSVNASFSIPSWISLVVVGNGNVNFASITGPGTYVGSNNTQLRVLSTTNWSLSSSILWASSTMPEGASEATVEEALGLTFDKTSGAWGIHNVSVSYRLSLAAEDVATLPQGDYNVVIQYTATTD
ncbi:MAG: hypothetical protein AB1778_09355 [Candidatus Bipolaricaulota bacterium]